MPLLQVDPTTLSRLSALAWRLLEVRLVSDDSLERRSFWVDSFEVENKPDLGARSAVVYPIDLLDAPLHWESTSDGYIVILG